MLSTAAEAMLSVEDPDVDEAVAEAAEADEADCDEPPGAVPEAEGRVEEDAGAEALEALPPDTEPPVLIPAASEYGYGLL